MGLRRVHKDERTKKTISLREDFGTSKTVLIRTNTI